MPDLKIHVSRGRDDRGLEHIYFATNDPGTFLFFSGNSLDKFTITVRSIAELRKNREI